MDDFLDDLRDLDDDGSSSIDTDFEMSFDDDEIPVQVGQVIGEEDAFAETADADTGPFLGMSAGERAFLSMMLFFNVLVLGIGLLLATNRIAI